MKQILTLIRKELLLEWRQKHTLFGVLLYVGCTVFVIYMMMGRPESAVWNAMYWISMLFITVNAVAKSFLQESEARARYYMQLVSPSNYLIAKMTYSILLMAFICVLSLGLFFLLLGIPLKDSGLFVGIAVTGSLSLSVLFTFLSAIAAQARQNAALMAILGFPIAIPILMMLSRISVAAIGTTAPQQSLSSMLLVLVGIDILIVGLGLVLFPFLWKE